MKNKYLHLHFFYKYLRKLVYSSNIFILLETGQSLLSILFFISTGAAANTQSTAQTMPSLPTFLTELKQRSYPEQTCSTTIKIP